MLSSRKFTEGVQLQLSVEATVHPTEDSEKVQRAVLNLFPTCELTRQDQGRGRTVLVGRAEGLDSLKNLRALLRQERIRAAARRTLLNAMSGSTMSFHMNKQAAFVGRASFSQPYGESPLGTIAVVISSTEPIAVIDWLSRPSRA